MSLTSPPTFLILCVAVVALSWRFGRRASVLTLCGLSLAFIVTLYPSPTSLAVLLGAIAVHFVSLRAMQAADQRLRRAIFYVWLTFGLTGFIIVKKYTWATSLILPYDWLNHDLSSIGYSFLLFRQIHMSIEVRDDPARLTFDLVNYLAYQLAFWTFLAGPIQRFPDFQASVDRMAGEGATTRETLLGLNRAMIGFFKMFLVAASIKTVCGSELFLSRPSVISFLIMAMAFPAYLYINFSGYCDIALGLAQAVGFTLPENFNCPFLARNSVEFWNRWHISLSEFFRDYMFFPLQVALARHGRPLVALAVAALASFTVMGAWHGSHFRFVIFGLIHGLGVLSCQLYGVYLKKRCTRETRQFLAKSRAIRCLSIVGFQSFVVLSFLPFQFDPSEIRKLGAALVGG